VYFVTVIAGYRWTDIAACVQWMTTFASVLEDAGPTDVKFCSKVTPAEAHTLQTHVVSIRTVVSVTYLLT